MKLSKSKLALAKVINENGGWVDGAQWAAQDKRGATYKLKIWFYSGNEKHYTAKGCTTWQTDYKIHNTNAIQHDKLLPNWHQTILSREEYYQVYPKDDADGWIEWKGGDNPLNDDSCVDLKFSSGNQKCSLLAGAFRWRHSDCLPNIIAYRLHKPDVKPEFSESVTRSIPEPDADDAESRLSKALDLVKSAAPHLLSDKYKFNGDEVMGERKQTIEQLAKDYRNKLDFSNLKQQEADEAKVYADAALSELERAGEEIGLLIAVAKGNSAVDYLDWNSWVAGDLVELVNRQGGMAKVGEIGPISKVVGGGDFYVNFPSQSGYSVEH